MRASLGLLLLVACGGTQPPRPPPEPVKPAPPSAATCSDVGVILRGEIESEDPDAGPAKEKVYATSCEQEKWSQAIIDCVAGTPQPSACLDKLDEPQRAAFEERLQKWQVAYTEPADVDVVASPDCHDVLADTRKVPPVLAEDAPEQAWQQKMRGEVLVEACEHDWPDALKICIEAASDEADVAACLAKDLDIADSDALRVKLADIGKLAAKIAAVKKKPATITCAKVVAAHYGDRAWKQKLDGYKPAERKKMIAASRDKMTKACTADAWDDTLRACLVVGGGEICLVATGMRLRWGYPAAGVVTATGIPECDAYAATSQKMAACQTLPQSSREALARSLDQLLAQIAAAPADRRAQMGTSCAAALEAITQALSSVGC